jgi:hypothetical protein
MIFSACSAKQPTSTDVRSFADPMTENILMAINKDNYSDFSRDFNDKMKIALSEGKYEEKVTPIKQKIGVYITDTKEYLGYEVKSEKVIVRYKAKFTQEPEDVIVKVIFTEQGDKEYISGFWLNSPKLRTQ